MDNVMGEIELELHEATLHEANLQMKKTLQAMPAFSAVDSQLVGNMISSLTRALRRVREAGLSQSSIQHDRHSSREEVLYWSNLRRLEKALPALHIQLRMKRANLDRSLSHRKTVTRWVEGNKEIF
jgi:hypothetical protein